MKKLSLLLLLTFNSIQASNYECTMSGIQYFPEQIEISLNPKFIIEGFAFSQKHIEDFKEREVYLESATGEMIVLKLQEILKGQMGLTQAIFRTEKALSANTRYFLKISEPTRENQLKEFTAPYNRKNEEFKTVYWETSEIENVKPLNPEMKIAFQDTEVEYYGCGPAAYAVFQVAGKDDAEVWYRTEMEDLKTNRKTIFYIREWQDKLNVGHGMCSGAFTYTREGKYRVRFTPVNIDGKELKTTDWTTFDSPFLNAENPWGF